MASAELWPSSAENILYFGVQKRLRAFLYPIFTGWGVGNKLPQSKPQALTEGVHTPLYDRIMNLYKHFCKGLDSRAKTVIMVLALRNKEC